MSQSQMRAPGRPASFGRAQAEGAAPAEDFSIRGGQSFHLVLHVDVTPSAASLEALHAAIRETTRDAVLAGYADAFAEMDAPERPGDVHGGASPGPEQVPGDGDGGG